MNYENLAPDRSSPFAAPSDTEAWYMNLRYREALATLRYGVEAGKGLIVCIGEAGTGKSMLLEKLARESRAGVTFLLISDPHLSLSEILRRLLRRLELEPASENEAALFRQCHSRLQTLAEGGQVVAVAFDDAHHMADDTVEQILQNFLGPGVAHTGAHAVQIIFAGRPELKAQLLRAPLRNSAEIAVECALTALSVSECRDYIRFRLRSARLAEDTFDAAALQSIAHFSAGRLSLINALCGRAIQGVDPSAQTQVGADRVESAAKDLGLWRPRWVRSEEQERRTALPPKNEEIFRFEFLGEDTTKTVGETFVHLAAAHAGGRWFGSERHGGKFPRTLTVSALLVVVALWLYSDLLRSSMSKWNSSMGGLAALKREPLSEPELPQIAGEAESKNAPALAPAQGDSHGPPPTEEILGGTAAKIEPPAPPSMPKSQFDAEEAPAPRPSEARTPPVPEDFSNEVQIDAVAQISKAIENRAIAGVRATVKDDIAFLDGRVATERQRRAAERAARETGEVRGVVNRIVIDHEPPPRRQAGARSQPPQELAERTLMNPAAQISKAIENRAIAGVRVTVKDDIAFLDGRVATERQRRAAERAAREAGEVRGVRNRIVIE